MGAYQNVKHFRDDCRQQFQFLLTDYGFKELGTPRGYTMRLANASTMVEVEAAGYGTDIRASIGRIEREKGEYESYAMEFLVWFRDPNSWSIDFDSGGQEHQMQLYAKLLQEYGSDILSGDFSHWAEIRKTRRPPRRPPKKKQVST